MNKKLIKDIFLGEIGVGLLLIIIQLMIGFKYDGNIFQIIGYNIFTLLGLANIIDGVKKIKKDKK